MPATADALARPGRVRLAREVVALAMQAAWPRGRHVTEAELVRALGVSRTPIRSALRLLADEGVVEARRNQGFFLLREHSELAGVGLEPAPSAGERLYGTILRERISGVLPRDVRQSDLVLRYGASRTLAEQVVLRLAEDGLLLRREGRTLTFVETLTEPGSIRASYDFRIMIEPAALLLPHYRPDRGRLAWLRDRQLDLLDRVTRALGSRDAGDLPPRSAILAVDAEFHQTLSSFSHNPFAATALKHQVELRRLLEFGMNEDGAQIAVWCREHAAILDALLERDHARAASLMAAHLDRAARDALAALAGV